MKSRLILSSKGAFGITCAERLSYQPLGSEKSWLPPNPTGAQHLLPFPAELLTSYPVTPKMNRAFSNDPAAITPLQPAIT